MKRRILFFLLFAITIGSYSYLNAEIVVLDSRGKEVKLSQGDSGALWILEIFGDNDLDEGLKKYEPGYYKWSYPVYVLKDGNKSEGEADVKVLVRDEF